MDQDYVKIASKIIHEAFKDKKDKSGQPYTKHLYHVADKASDCDGRSYSIDIHCVGLLHDLLEDCPEWSEKALRQLIPSHIVDAVVALTKGRNEPYADYITRVLHNEIAVLVKKADLEHNMDITRLPELTDKDIDRLKKYHKAYLRITDKKDSSL